MYDIDKRKNISKMTVEEVINELSKLPSTAKVICCGDECVWLHVEKDGSVVSFDTEDLDDCYENSNIVDSSTTRQYPDYSDISKELHLLEAVNYFGSYENYKAVEKMSIELLNNIFNEKLNKI